MGIFLSINDISKSTVSFSSLDAPLQIDLSGDIQTELLEGHTVSGSFTSKYNNLGVISLRFYNFDRINDDSISFSIKELDQDKWYYQSNYKTDQFQPHQLFPFGFPPIKKSANKTYFFQIKSLDGVHNNAIMLEAQKNPDIVLRYQLHNFPIKHGSTILFYLKGILYQIFSMPKLIFKIISNFYYLFFVYGLFKLISFNKIAKKNQFRTPVILLFISYIFFTITINTVISNKILTLGLLFWLTVVILDDFLSDISVLIAILCFIFMAIPNTITPYFSENLAIWGIMSLSVAVIQKIVFHLQKQYINIDSVKMIFKMSSVIKAIKSIIVWPFVCKNFWLGFLAYFKISSKNHQMILYKFFNGLKMYSDGNCTDFQIFRELFVHDVYFKNFPLTPHNPVIVDIGAHKGYFSLFAINKYPNAKIYSFEPSPENFAYLQKNIKINRKKIFLFIN